MTCDLETGSVMVQKRSERKKEKVPVDLPQTKKMLSCITKNNEKRNLTPPVGCTCTIQEVFLLGLVDK